MHVWAETSDQDWRIVEENAFGIHSPTYKPGPDSELHEGGEIPFVERYARFIEAPARGRVVPRRGPAGILSHDGGEPTYQSLTDHTCACVLGGMPFPTALDPFTCNRYACAEFAREAFHSSVRYIRLCGDAAPYHICAIAEALGCTAPRSRYSPDMKHAFFGSDAAIPEKDSNRRVDI